MSTGTNFKEEKNRTKHGKKGKKNLKYVHFKRELKSSISTWCSLEYVHLGKHET